MNPSAEPSKPIDPRDTAVEAYRAFLQQAPHAGDVEFEELCGEKPELADELRRLHSVAMLARSITGSASFRQCLREAFGEEAEVKLTLDEANSASDDDGATVMASLGVPPSGGPGGGPAEAGTPNRGDRYALEGEVARGGMGIIYKVRDRELNRTLAMKVMLVGSAAVASPSPWGPGGEGRGVGRGEGERQHPLLSRFLEEVQVTAQLDHPGIVAVHELGLDAAGRPYFTMKLVKGRDLSRIFELARAEQEGWNLPRAVGALIKACQAVAFAHTKGVIHRDLKPANIMVGRFGEVYVMDWGLAKVTGRKDLHDIRVAPDSRISVSEIQTPRAASGSTTADSPLITMDGSVVGTPAYMPPEQAKGQVEQVDALSDIYSLGAILYNLLTGQAPYVEPGARISPHTILARALDGPPKRIHTLNPKAPAELVAICEKAMARERRDRYASSLDLAEDLQAFLDHRVVKAYRTGAVAEFKSWVLRNKKLAALSAVVAVLPAIGVAVFIYQQDLAKERLRRNAYAADMRVAFLSLEEQNLGHAEELLRKYLPRRGEEDLRGFEWRYLWQQCQGDETHTLKHESIVNTAIYSPDGRLLATASFDGTVRIWDAGTKSQVKVLTGFPQVSFARYICFSPNGQWFAASRGETVIIWNTSTWAEVKTLPGSASALIFSPDGRWLAGWVSTGICIWDTSLWKPRILATAIGRAQGSTALAFSAGSDRLVAAGFSKNVEVWNADSGERVRDLEFRIEDPVDRYQTCVALSKNDVLAVGQRGGAVKLWDLKTGTEIATTNAHPRTVWNLAFSPDGRTLATASFDQTVKLWDVASLGTLATFRGHRDEVWSVAFSPDGSFFVTGSKDRTAKFWNTQPPVISPLIPCQDRTAHFSRDSRFLVTVATSRTNVVMDYWDAKTGQHSQTWRLSEEAAFGSTLPRLGRAPLLSGDGRKLACALNDGTINLWDLEKMALTPTAMVGQFSTTNSSDSFGFSRDDRLLVVKSQDRWRLWDLLADRERALPAGMSDWYEGAPSLSPDGRILAGPSTYFTFKLWDLQTQRELTTLQGHAWVINYGRFSPDGKLLATFGWESFVRLWRVPSGLSAAPPFRGHKEGSFNSDFSPDGKTLATSTTEFTTRLWHVQTGQELMALEGTRSPIFAPDGNILAVRTRLDEIRLLRAPSLAEIDAAERIPVGAR